MFLVRSAFWLSAAFIVMAPTVGMDVGEAARSTGEQLLSQGAQVAADALLPESCGTIECAVGRAVIGQATGFPDAPRTVETAPHSAPPSSQPAAFPPPRPDWAY